MYHIYKQYAAWSDQFIQLLFQNSNKAIVMCLIYIFLNWTLSERGPNEMRAKTSNSAQFSKNQNPIYVTMHPIVVSAYLQNYES